MYDTDKIIVTSQPEAAVIVLNEIKKYDSEAKLLLKLSQEAQLILLPGGYFNFLENKVDKTIFIRHIFPVHYAGDVTAWSCEDFISTGNANDFSVQMRSDKKNEDAIQFVYDCENAFTQRGWSICDKNPTWVLSLYFNERFLYAGLSKPADNLSAWNGGAVRFKKEEGFISRAEFKLLEAFAVFGIHLRPQTRALDLGAAPGGWTKVLLAEGCLVTAVDPADLHESIQGHPRLTVIKSAAQKLSKPDKRYGLIVNDMRMDAMDSARIMLDMADWLADDGLVLMTIKLSNGHWYKKTMNVIHFLQKKYRIIAARQLFHNRDEVTVYMQKESKLYN